MQDVLTPPNSAQTIGNSESVRREEFYGTVYKCPNCGGRIDSYQTHCDLCGYEVRGVSKSTVSELAAQLDRIESLRPRKKKGRRLGTQLEETDLRKINLIRSFGIPNTKEALLDFAVLAASNIDYADYAKYGESSISEAWVSSLRQSYEKSRIIGEGSTENAAIKRLVEESEKKIRKEKRKSWLSILATMGVVCGILAVILIIDGVARVVQGEQYDINMAENHLERVLYEIEDDMVNGEYEAARNKAYTLTFDKELSQEKAEYWEQKQKLVLEQIDRAERRDA